MQGVFALSAVAMFVPVIFHTTRVKEQDSLNRDAPGALPAFPLQQNSSRAEIWSVLMRVHGIRRR